MRRQDLPRSALSVLIGNVSTISLTAATLLLLSCMACSGPSSRNADNSRSKAEEPANQTPADEQSTGQGVAGASLAVDGKELYLQHCAACHGDRGDGKGTARPYLFPKPRDFRAGRYRLVSTENRVPTIEDLDAVLVRGMPGSAMPSWGHLAKAERIALIEELMQMRREGAREEYVTYLLEEEGLEEDEMDEPEVQQEIDEFVTGKTTQGSSTIVPEIGAPDDAAIARGKRIYVDASCHSCHGNEGKGDGVEKQFDDEGFPTWPRDYTRGIFKGGHDPASLFRRIAYGMPGTPMPSAPNLTPEQAVDLVHFLRSMSDEATREAVVTKRRHLTAKRVEQIPDATDAQEWESVEFVRLGLMPLWWRDDRVEAIEVRVIHDGSRIAAHLTWPDDTENGHAAQSESFEDAVAIELYSGDTEPFIGMGDPKSPVDVWFWDADRQGEPLAVEDLYTSTVVDRFPFSETVVATAELDREGARTSDQPDISLPARASGDPIVPSDDESGGSSLTVGGPGSVTFRIPQSQHVKATGQWKDGRWTVVMTRSLAVESEDDGVGLAAGGRASVAFAVWDGSHADRDGKKLVSIWQDLELQD